MNANFFRRFLAYFIDMVILGMIITLSLMLFSNKNSENLITLNNEVREVNEQLLEKEITSENYIYRYAELNYQIDKMEVIDNILNSLYIILLFVYVPFILKGQTLGMKLTKIRIVKDDGLEANLNDYLFRSILIYSLGHLFITLAVIYVLPSFVYFTISSSLLFLEFLLVFISVFMILYRHDRKGIHDILTRTKVIKI